MHVLHLHGFQCQDWLASTDALAWFHQHRDHAAIHGGTHLAVAAAGRGRLRRREGKIADRTRDATAHESESIAGAMKSDALHDAAGEQADGVVADIFDLEALLTTAVADDIAAFA